MGLFSPFCLRTQIFCNGAVSTSPTVQCALTHINQLCGLVSGCTAGNGFIKQLQEPCTFIQRCQISSSLSGSSPYKSSSFFDSTRRDVVSARALSLRRTSAFSFLMVFRLSLCCLCATLSRSGCIPEPCRQASFQPCAWSGYRPFPPPEALRSASDIEAVSTTPASWAPGGQSSPVFPLPGTGIRCCRHCITQLDRVTSEMPCAPATDTTLPFCGGKSFFK